MVDHLEIFQALFVAQLTAKEQIDGIWQYAWLEQTADPMTGQYANTPSGRAGSVTLSYATELNNTDTPTFIYRWMKFKSIVNGQPVYEFVFDGNTQLSSSSFSTSFTVTCVEIVTDVQCVDGMLQVTKDFLYLPPGGYVSQTPCNGSGG